MAFKKCSCITQLIECLNDLTNNFDNKIQTDAIYFDFAKAFDTVPHKRLILKLQQAGTHGLVLEWIRSFLENRRQRVILGNTVSSWRTVTSGVPQGSILGPVLFLIYVNDLPDIVHSTAKMFADDTKVYRQIQNWKDAQELQDLIKLASWSKQWLLDFNAIKCMVMSIRNSLKYTYTLNGHVLNSEESQRDLGVTKSNDLKPHLHITKSVNKANNAEVWSKDVSQGLPLPS